MCFSRASLALRSKTDGLTKPAKQRHRHLSFCHDICSYPAKQNQPEPGFSLSCLPNCANPQNAFFSLFALCSIRNTHSQHPPFQRVKRYNPRQYWVCVFPLCNRYLLKRLHFRVNRVALSDAPQPWSQYFRTLLTLILLILLIEGFDFKSDLVAILL